MLCWMSGEKLNNDRQFLFVDRDGVINFDSKEYIKRWDEFRFYPDALDALTWLKRRRICVIIISNQSALDRGIVDWREFWNIHQQMVKVIREHGGDILAAYYCPHRPEANCQCRKPSSRMLLEAASTYGIDLRLTPFIGDKLTDIEAALAAGCKPVFLARGGVRPPQVNKPFSLYDNLLDCVMSLFEYP